MTYHINVHNKNIKEFLQIVNSLRSLGVIESINSSKDLVRDGEPLEEDALLNILDNSKQEIKDGKSLSMEDVKKQIENWKKK